jgi:hypothetical protein
MLQCARELGGNSNPLLIFSFNLDAFERKDLRVLLY